MLQTQQVAAATACMGTTAQAERAPIPSSCADTAAARIVVNGLQINLCGTAGVAVALLR
jgi:hypothetical protein